MADIPAGTGRPEPPKEIQNGQNEPSKTEYTGKDGPVAQLMALHAELRQLRSRLPELMQALAAARDEQNSLQLFHTVARDATTWRNEVTIFMAHYEELGELMKSLEAKAVEKHNIAPTREQGREHGVPEMPTGLDYGLELDDMGGMDDMGHDYLDLT